MPGWFHGTPVISLLTIVCREIKPKSKLLFLQSLAISHDFRLVKVDGMAKIVSDVNFFD